MKTKIKKMLIPLVVAVLAIAGAFASNLSNQSDNFMVDRRGYVKAGLSCERTSITCSTVFNEQLCTDGANILYDWNGTSCPMVLYHKP